MTGTTLTKAPSEPTTGDVLIAIQTLENAGASKVVTTAAGRQLIHLSLLIVDEDA